MRMSILCLISLMLISAGAAGQTHRWSYQFSDEFSTRTRALCMGADGNLVIGGNVDGTVDFGDGVLAAGGYVAKFDPDGQVLWSGSYGSNQVIVNGVASDLAGNSYAAGQFTGSVDFGGGSFVATGITAAFLVKFDPSGNHLWSKAFDDDSINAWDVDCHEDGRVAITGRAKGSYDFGGGLLTTQGTDVFVAGFDADGSHLFSDVFGDGEDQSAAEVAVGPDGQVVVGGLFYGSVDFGGGLLTAVGTQWHDAYLAMFNAEGTHLWSQRYGDESSDKIYSVDCDAQGNVVAAGHFHQSIDFGGGALSGGQMFAAKFDVQGNHLWSQRFGNGLYEAILRAAAAPGGSVLLFGLVGGGPIDLGGGPMAPVNTESLMSIVAKLDADGVHEWSDAFESSEIANSRGVLDFDGNAYLAGDFWPRIDFGGGEFTVAGGALAGGYDIYLASFASEGVPTHRSSMGSLKRLFGGRE